MTFNGSIVISRCVISDSPGGGGADALGTAGCPDGVLGADSARPIMGATGIGDGRTAFSFDGGDYVNAYSSALSGAFNGSKGWLLAWVRITDAAVWADGTTRRFLRLFTDAATNHVTFFKSATANTIQVTRAGNSVNSIVADSSLAASTDWFLMGATWDQTADEVKAYLNGSQVGATQTGLGAWAGTLDAAKTVLGAEDTSSTAPHKGLLAHVAVGAGAVLSAANFATIYAAKTGDMNAAIMAFNPVAYWMLDDDSVTGGESVAPITLSPRPSPGMIGWRKCSASERAEGGYYRANVTMTGPLDYLADFMLNGLMRDVRFYGPDGVQCWEGFVYEMTLNRKTAEIKISMDRVANNVWMRYRVTGSGTTVRSTAQTDADSQERYGIRDYVLTGGELENSVVADSKCAQYLQLNRQPKPTRSGPGRPDEEYSLEILCRGYFDTLNNQCYNATVAGSQGASAEVTDIITAKGQFVSSTDIRSNATPVSEVYDVDRRAGDIVQDIARLGDANPKRWLARMTNDRVFQYISAAAASATVGSA